MSRIRRHGTVSLLAAVISSREVAVTKAEAEVADKDLVVTSECTRAPKGVDPDGPRCRAAKKLAAESRERLDAARDKLEKSGVAPKSDPMAKRLAAVVPGLTEEAVLLYQPLTLPLTISLLGILLIAAGARPKKHRKVKERRGKTEAEGPRQAEAAAAGEPQQCCCSPQTGPAPTSPRLIHRGLLYAARVRLLSSTARPRR